MRTVPSVKAYESYRPSWSLARLAHAVSAVRYSANVSVGVIANGVIAAMGASECNSTTVLSQGMPIGSRLETASAHEMHCVRRFALRFVRIAQCVRLSPVRPASTVVLVAVAQTVGASLAARHAVHCTHSARCRRLACESHSSPTHCAVHCVPLARSSSRSLPALTQSALELPAVLCSASQWQW